MGWNPETECRLINEGLRLWGHQYVYNETELKSLIKSVDFVKIVNEEWGKSKFEDLKNRETRPFHNEVILEATK